jgi:hypothetical protein
MGGQLDALSMIALERNLQYRPMLRAWGKVMEHTAESTTYPMPASEQLKDAVREIMQKKGRLYAQIPHPDFADWPAGHYPHRRQAIIEPHLECQGGTVVELGAYLAAFSHWLEDLGYRVTAVERNAQYASIAREIRDLCGKSFTVFEGNFYQLANLECDILFALNVFHHSLKRKDTFERLDSFLGSVQCKMVIFESHDPSEHHMVNAYRRMDQEEFAQHVASRVGLSDIQEIGTEGKRKIFKIK